MARTRTTSDDAAAAAPRATLARSLAPEDVCPGDDVAVLHEVCEVPSYMWCSDSALLPRDEVVRIRTMPTAEAVPLKVRAVCLPFVLVREPGGRERTLDVRRCRLVRLDGAYAAAAWKAYKRAARQPCGGAPDRTW